MKNILWYQNPDNSGDDFVFFNRNPITPPTNPLYADSFEFLLNGTRSKKYYSSNQVLLYRLKDGFLINDHLEDRDVVGRKIPFLFYSDAENINDFIKQIQATTDEIGLKYDLEKFKIIRRLDAEKKILKSNLVIIAITIILILIFKSIIK